MLTSLKDELQPDRSREIGNAIKSMQAFANEVRRHFEVNRSDLRDPMSSWRRYYASSMRIPPLPRGDEMG